jgi:uncharacterized protein YbaR (Trm112 family)
VSTHHIAYRFRRKFVTHIAYTYGCHTAYHYRCRYLSIRVVSHSSKCVSVSHTGIAASLGRSYRIPEQIPVSTHRIAYRYVCTSYRIPEQIPVSTHRIGYRYVCTSYRITEQIPVSTHRVIVGPKYLNCATFSKHLLPTFMS